MGKLLDRVASEQMLLDAWEEVHENSMEGGDPNEAVEEFAREAASHIARISDGLMDGSWTPKPVVHFQIPKKGGTRNLAIPSIEDRIVDRAVKEVLDEVVDPLLMPWSVAYRRGMGVQTAIGHILDARDEGRTWIVRCDIKDCFPQIPRTGVLARLYEVCPDAALSELVRKLVHRRVVGKNAPRLPRGRGLHQGSPLSPLLANLYLDRFDRAMAEEGFITVRYADDIAIPVVSRAEGERALTVADKALRRLKLELNAGKSDICSLDNGVEFLGQTITNRSGPGRDEVAHPLETTVYVEQQGALLRSRGGRVVVEHEGEVLARVNFRRVREVVLHGRIGMTSHFLQQALSRGTKIVLTEDDGRYVGEFTPVDRATPHLRLAQYRSAERSNSSLDRARVFVLGKLQNQRVLILRYGRSRNIDLKPHVTALEACRNSALTAGTHSTLMGCEGAGARAYFEALGKIIPVEWAFAGRARRPPPDPVNAMLSFGYTLLTNEGMSAACAAGLDPAIGFLHQPRNGRYSLALDLIEELRPVVVDSVVLSLITKRMVGIGDFDTTEELGCRLSPTARKLFISAYERRMLQLLTYLDTGRRVSYRVALHQQAKALARSLMGGEPYIPILWK